MSDYLFLFRGGFPMYEGWSPEEMQQHFKKWGAWIKRMSEDGHYQGGHPLSAEGKTVTGTGKVVKELNRIPGARKLKDYPFYPAALGEFHRRAGHREEARDYFAQALRLARSPSESRFPERKLEVCG